MVYCFANNKYLDREKFKSSIRDKLCMDVENDIIFVYNSIIPFKIYLDFFKRFNCICMVNGRKHNNYLGFYEYINPYKHIFKQVINFYELSPDILKKCYTKDRIKFPTGIFPSIGFESVMYIHNVMNFSFDNICLVNFGLMTKKQECFWRGHDFGYESKWYDSVGIKRFFTE